VNPNPEGEILLLAGTRPEAIKIAPVVRALRDGDAPGAVVLSTGQHPELVEQALAAFDLQPDHVLALRRVTGSQAELASLALPPIEQAITEIAPAAVVVQGDTTTALLGALAGFWAHVPVVHLESGLRSGDLARPFPEEANRRLIATLASLHLAPTAKAVANLAAEGVSPDRIVLTGNTVVDAVDTIAEADRPPTDPVLQQLFADLTAHATRLVLVTAHRRESWGAPLDRIIGALQELLERHPDLRVLLPMHPNPAVIEQWQRGLGDNRRVTLTRPLPYAELIYALRRSTLVLSDSGGLQEEAPSVGVPLLVLRDLTERSEAVDAGCAELTGTDPQRIVAAADRILRGSGEARVAHNPFGDGRSGPRSAQAIRWLLGHGARPADLAWPPT
jgi:UDP-N-acetylglucosamine 2-epimerase (non-hydrolysing)